MPNKILVIQLRQLGDIILTMPTFREIKKQSPEASISFLSHKMAKPILKSCPYIDEHLIYDETSLLSNIKLQSYIRAKKFDLVLDFMNNPRSALITFLSGAKKTIAFQSSRWLAYSMRVLKPKSPTYIVDEKFELLRKAGFSPNDSALYLSWQDSDMKPYRSLKSKFSLAEQDAIKIVMSPTHRREVRKWPHESYLKLCEKLFKDWGAVITWVWGPGSEEAEIDRLIQTCKVPSYKAPKTTLMELAALINQHDLFIGNSNGPSHIAVASDTCSLQLHGHTDARSWCPMNSKHRAIQSKGFGANRKQDLSDITVEAVWEQLKAFKPIIEQERKTKCP